MSKSKKKIIIISSIAAGAVVVAVFATFIGIDVARINNRENLYKKGVAYLVNGEYKESAEVFANSLLKDYKDSAKKYSYAFNLQKYEQHYYTYEQLIDSGLEENKSVAVVDFLTSGGTQVPRKVINEKQSSTYIIETTSKANYDFLGWNLNYATYEKETDAIRYILESVYNNHYFNITYDYDGGEPLSLAPTKYQYNMGDMNVPNAKKNGYIFTGYESSIYDNPTVDFVIPNGTAKDLELKATYTPKTIHVKFDWSPMAITTELDVLYGSDVREVFPRPNRNYYTFDGWYYKGKLVDLEQFTIDHDVTLQAKYSTINYNVTYALNGGTPASELPTTYTAESNFSLPFVEKENALFIGWQDDSVYNPLSVEYKFPPLYIADRVVTANFVDATVVNNKLIDIADHTVKEIVIPSYITKIDPFMLSTLENLETIYVDARNGHYTVEDNLLIEDGHVAFSAPRVYLNNHLIITLPTHIDEIGSYAFRGSNITQISSTHFISKINEGAFANCNDLVTCNFNNVSYVGNEAFKYTKIGDAFLTNNKYSLNYIGYQAFYNVSFTKIDIANSVIHIGDEAFSNCYSVAELIYHPNFNSELGTDIFAGCSYLSKVETDVSFINDLFTNSLSGTPVKNIKITGSGTIVSELFKDNTQIENVDLSDSSIVRIKQGAFEGCEKLTSIDLSAQTNLFLIESYAFKGTGLTSIDLSNNIHLTLDNHAFDSCANLTSVKMRHGQIGTRMGDVFSLCGSIKNVEYIVGETDDDISIPGFMFANLNNVETITIKYLGEDNKVINFGNGAFKGDSNLVTITMDNCHVDSLPSYCFEDCVSFKNTGDAFSNLNSYGEGAFFNCTQLDNLTLTGTTSIGRVAFAGCFSLCNNQPLTIPNTVASIGEEAFDDIVGEIHLDFTQEEVNTLSAPGGAWNRFNVGFAGLFTYKS